MQDNSALPLSVLDVSPIPSGKTASDALANTVDLAKHVESLGFQRYWVAEHHNAGSLACSAPEILIGQIAAATKTLRVGAGGIMLPNHAPLKVAETFRVLHALFPNRLDLGLGRAAGTDPRTASLLRRAAPSLRAGDEFPNQMNELLAFFEDDGPPREAFARTVRASPFGVPTPKIWILGSSEYGGAFAAKNGFGFALAHHINPVDADVTMKKYRADFQASAYCAAPYAILAVSAICAEDDTKARELEEIAAFSGLLFALGLRDIPLPSLAEAREHVWGDDDRALADASKLRGFVGTSNDVAERLRNLARACEADELMVMSNTHDHDARKKSFTLLAAAFRND